VAKLLLFIAVILVIYLLIRNHRRRGEVAPPPAARSSEDMVRCRVCGVHLPTSEAVTSRGEYFCGKEHMQLANRGGH
jgi:uncharacterized protein